MSKVDVHNYKRRLEIALRKVDESNIPEDAKKDIFDFNQYSLAKGLTNSRMVKYIYNLILAAELLGKSFTEATKEDLVRVVNQVLQKDWADHTKHDFNVIMKRFYKWLEGGDEEYPQKVKWIPTTLKNVNKKLPEELLTKDEVIALINAAEHPRDKALVSVLYESGCRIGEILSLRMKHVNIDELGGQIIVDGKTGMRRVRLVVSIPYLTIWLEHHPLKNKPDAPLWPIIGKRNHHDFFKYKNANKLLKNLADKAGINKRVNPHIFRHSRATLLANHLTEAQMNHYFGWIQGSRMPSTYVHLSGRDLDRAILELNGIKKLQEEKQDKTFVLKQCERCGEANSPTSLFCKKCYAPLGMNIALKIEEKRKEMDATIATLMKDQEVLNLISRKMKYMNIRL